MEPFLSVIVTAYNRKDFLRQALASAVNQTLDRKRYPIQKTYKKLHLVDVA